MEKFSKSELLKLVEDQRAKLTTYEIRLKGKSEVRFVIALNYCVDKLLHLSFHCLFVTVYPH